MHPLSKCYDALPATKNNYDVRKTITKSLFAINPFLHYSAKLMGAAGIEPASSAVLL